jgi:hypothetical protein
MARQGQNLACSFCGKPRDAVGRLIAGPDVFICDACVTLCNEILATIPRPGSDAPGATPSAPRTQRSGWWRRFLPEQREMHIGMPLG